MNTANLPTNLMLKLLIIPHPGPAEFFCLKRPLNVVKICKGLDEKDMKKHEAYP